LSTDGLDREHGNVARWREAMETLAIRPDEAVDPTAITAEASRVAPGLLCLHAVASTPAWSKEPIR